MHCKFNFITVPFVRMQHVFYSQISKYTGVLKAPPDNPWTYIYSHIIFSLSNTRVYFSIFVFSILVIIRVVHLMEQSLAGVCEFFKMIPHSTHFYETLRNSAFASARANSPRIKCASASACVNLPFLYLKFVI